MVAAGTGGGLMPASMMQPPPKASEDLVRDIMRATLVSLEETDDGAHWCAQILRKRGWSVVAPAETMEGKD